MPFNNLKLLFCHPALSYEGGSPVYSATHILLKDGDKLSFSELAVRNPVFQFLGRNCVHEIKDKCFTKKKNYSKRKKKENFCSPQLFCSAVRLCQFTGSPVTQRLKVTAPGKKKLPLSCSPQPTSPQYRRDELPLCPFTQVLLQ